MFAGVLNGCQPLFRMAKNFLCCSHCKDRVIVSNGYRHEREERQGEGGGCVKNST